MKRFRVIILFGLLLFAAAAFARLSQSGKGLADYPPAKPQGDVSFRVPEPGEWSGMSLDEPWQYMQTLIDADTLISNWRNYLNAVPVGLDFTHNGRGFLATLHTIFVTTNGGRTWTNLDPYPPPNIRPSDYTALRSPTYLTALSARQIERDTVRADTVLFTTMNIDTDSGSVRLIYYLSAHRLYPQTITRSPHWLNCVTVCDSAMGIAAAGLDGHLFENDSLWLGLPWEDMSPNKVLIRPGRQDSLVFSETWVGAMTSIDRFAIAVGSHQWVSRDGGVYWMIRPAADSLYDNAVSFCDSAHGITGGGRLTPQSEGWVHITTNGGLTWTGRILQTDVPIRAVAMVTPMLAFVAGGNYLTGTGKVWSTTDGGQSWTQVLDEGAEFKVLKATRVDNAHVDVLAAGVFPDFRGGVWRTRIFMPDTTRSVIIAEPDSLDFGTHAVNDRDTLTVVLRNIGTQTDTITGIQSVPASPHFSAIWIGRVALNPGQEISFRVSFNATAIGEFSTFMRVNNQRSGLVDVYCHASVPNASDPREAPLPEQLHLTVFPNPGNASFMLRYRLARESDVSLRIYDLAGRLVGTLHEGRAAAGDYARPWNAAERPSGIYFVRLETGTQKITQKVLLIK